MKNILKEAVKMKKALAALTVVAVLGLGAAAFAHGGFGWGGHMTGWGPGYYGHTGEDSEFLDKTAGLRKELNQKRFDYYEALRAGDEKKAEKIAKELDELSEKLYAKAPRGRSFARGGYGYGYGSGPHCW
jgi:hypothetical protein